MHHAPGNSAGEMEDAAATVILDGTNLLRLPGMDFAQQTEDVKHVSGENHSQMDMSMGTRDPQETMYFVIKDLKVGKMFQIYFPQIDPSKSFNFLSRKKVDSIPFSTKALPYLLQFFSISQDSPQAKAMQHTLFACEWKAPKGTIKYCATSLESLNDFIHSVFGSDSQFEILTTSQTTKSNSIFQNYNVIQSREITAPKMIACHNRPYPYSVYYCHTHTKKGATKVFKVSLSGDNGDRVEAISVCHMHTSHITPDHVSFRQLGIKPGTSEVCHFFSADDLVLVQR
ncbi:hypothetical protein REPUB_Repub04eG0061900 [Reevesia pubescens]